MLRMPPGRAAKDGGRRRRQGTEAYLRRWELFHGAASLPACVFFLSSSVLFQKFLNYKSFLSPRPVVKGPDQPPSPSRLH